MTRRDDNTPDPGNSDWPWEIQLTNGAQLEGIKALIKRAGRENRQVVIKVIKYDGHSRDLKELTAGAAESKVSLTIKSEQA